MAVVDESAGFGLKDSLGRTALHSATLLLNTNRWNFKIWKMIFDRAGKVVLNATDMFGSTSLHIACIADSCGSPHWQLKVIKTLLESEGVQMDIRDKYGLSAIQYAASSNRVDILEVFKTVRIFDIVGILPKMAAAQVAVKKARDIVQAEVELSEEIYLEEGKFDSDAEPSESDE
ncbi:hypothetical protein E0Z10_g9874 [Xylaria hypoxylon]|uniref:Uncharacterized protein n=1 Tax=Xylaria hypoxylon TaxID=37992 RepID=A0A4Z0Y7F9_9PEZI|nr:hypothetical protein E0Z10_g9874 [Xylaria hypoxylon]